MIVEAWEFITQDINLLIINIATCMGICVNVGLVTSSTLHHQGKCFLWFRLLMGFLMFPYLMKILERIDGDFPTVIDVTRDIAICGLLFIAFVFNETIFTENE